MKSWKKVLAGFGIVSMCVLSGGMYSLADEISDVDTAYKALETMETEAESDLSIADNVISEPQQTETYEAEVKKEGFVNENGNTYYYENNIKVTQKEKYLNGFWYYFDNDGIMVTGWNTRDGKTYYYDENGRMAHGIYEIDGKKYGFDEWTGVLLSGEHYFTDGSSDSWYYFSENASNKGEIVTGWNTRNGKTYYYDENGRMAHRIYKVGNKTYGFNEWTGVLLSGEHYFTDGSSDSWYYFSENESNKGELVTGWITHHGNKYYYDESGRMAHGVYKVGNVTYGFDEWTGVILNGEKYIGNAWRYFDQNGVMATGWTKHHGNQYYYKNDGAMYYGELNDNGNWYYFHEVTGVMATGWTKHHGNQYFYDDNGIMIHGELCLNNKWYYFDEWTGVMATGWTTHHGNRYYYDGNGVMAHGKYSIGGTDYYFDEWTGVLKSGWRYENGYKVYYDGNGRLVQNVESIIGKQSSYFLKVNTYTNTVTVFAKDGANGYIIPVKKMICSTGKAGTPTVKGTYTVRRYARWGTLMGPVYGQYCSQIYGGYLFHSAWYYTNGNNKTLSVSEYRKLGSNASHGCVRLTVADAKWIYDNCNGSTVYIYSGYSDGDPFTKPSRPNPVVLWGDRGYDPTDPAFA